MTKIADLALMDAHFPDLHVWDGSVLQVELMPLKELQAAVEGLQPCP